MLLPTAPHSELIWTISNHPLPSKHVNPRHTPIRIDRVQLLWYVLGCSLQNKLRGNGVYWLAMQVMVYTGFLGLWKISSRLDVSTAVETPPCTHVASALKIVAASGSAKLLIWEYLIDLKNLISKLNIKTKILQVQYYLLGSTAITSCSHHNIA